MDTSTPTCGQDALEKVAPAVAQTLRDVEASVWLAADDRGLLNMLGIVAEVAARVNGLPALSPIDSTRDPLVDGATSRRAFELGEAERFVLEFGERFFLDVSIIADADRASLFEYFDQRAATIAQCLWVVDFLPRAYAALDALFGRTGFSRPPGRAQPDLRAVIDQLILTVPRLLALDPITTEIVRLRGARQHNCRRCKSRRSRSALLAGADEETFQAIDEYPNGPFSVAQKAALRLTDELIWTPGQIAAEVLAEAHRCWSAAQLVELVLDVTRNSVNKISVALGRDQAEVTEGQQLYDVLEDGRIVVG
jgi:hypothetical protein